MMCNGFLNEEVGEKYIISLKIGSNNASFLDKASLSAESSVHQSDC